MQFGALVAVVVLTVIIFVSGVSFANPKTVSSVEPIVADEPVVRVSDVSPVVSMPDTPYAVDDTVIVEPAVAAPIVVGDVQSVASTAAPVVLPPATVEMQSTQNIETNSAQIRGAITVGTPEIDAVFFVYGYDQDEVIDSADKRTYRDVQDQYQDGLFSYKIVDQVTKDTGFYADVRGLAPDTRYYARLCGEVDSGLLCSEVSSFSTNPRIARSSDATGPTIGSLRIDHMSAESVRLQASVQMNDMEDGLVYLVYGQSRSQVQNAVGQEYRDIDEDGDDLQKKRAARDLRGYRDVIEEIDDLDDETDYYYIWCVEYDGFREGVICSYIRSFRTHTETFGQTPDISAASVVSNQQVAQLRGDVDMDDFRNGLVFFVYGTDTNKIENLEGRGTFNGLYQSVPGLQKRLVDEDLDRSDSYTYTVSDLVPNTTYTARLCVEYLNEDTYYREVAHIACGSSDTFTTS